MTEAECKVETFKHIERVRYYLRIITDKLTSRGISHDRTNFGAVGLIVGVLCTVFGLIGVPVDIEELFKWAIIPEIQYLEMLKGLIA